MWAGRTIAAAVTVLAAGCASVPLPEPRLDAQVAAVLERRGLGADALLVVDNLVRNGPPAPRAAPALVRELLARPLDALDAEAIFRQAIPASLVDLTPGAPRPFAELLQTYAQELVRAQQVLRDAVQPFDEELLLRQLQDGLPTPDALLALADAVDPEKLRQANRLFVDATARFARGLSRNRSLPEGQVFELEAGRIVIGTRGNDVHDLAPARGGRVSVVIDPGGDDEYRGSDLALHGFSAIIDLAGNDRYTMQGPGLGAALAGASLLIDFAGNDYYQAKFFAQGAAAFGFGALLDLAGDDRYRIEAWGQGFGIGDGTGLLWDRAGNDRYLAGGVPDPFNRAGGLSGAQGAAFGYRDSVGGGIGVLRDDAGDDTYEAQMFAQGLGYYYGLGLLWERGGNDQYRALQYAQGNGVHQAIGVLRDESGNDRYEVATGYAQGMGLDIAFGALIDLAGDDSYLARNLSQGSGTANGIGLLADTTGADRFAIGPDVYSWGHAEWMRALPTLAVLLHSPGAQFTRDGQPARPEERPLAVQPMTPRTREQADELAAWLAASQGCTARALALRANPTRAIAEDAVRSDCFRLQAAGVAALARLGLPLPADVVLPSFLRAIPPQEDTY